MYLHAYQVRDTVVLVLRALVNSLVCSFCTSSLSLVLFQISALIDYVTEEALLISVYLSTDTVSDLRMLWVLDNN